ncbi:alpha-taxilin-like [Lethenteron reissneri]|uniref:alpha-taxilin-like n=1 Tax=Lethenteron reissneri TaxID=7753 RepID=UPI002AB70355|nr:alpha-taxilin-like [Lethenteron reissneri]XP_061430611.1 alpha-taxilin-like [Lethenteron reissneri]
MEAEQLTCPPCQEAPQDPTNPETPSPPMTPEATATLEIAPAPEGPGNPETAPEGSASLEAEVASQSVKVGPASPPQEAPCKAEGPPAVTAEAVLEETGAQLIEPGKVEEAELSAVQELLTHPVNKKKFAKLLVQLMESLSDFASPEEKLAALCSRYTEMSLQARSSRQLAAAASHERDLLRTDNHRLLLMKGKLETLCRELQRNNKQLLDESLERVHTEEKKRREMTEHFQATLDNIRKQMELNEGRSDRLRGENQELAERLSTLLRDYAQREEQVAKILKYRELQQQLSAVKLQEESELRRDGEQRHERDKEFLLHQAAESKLVLKVMEEKEEALKRQLLLYTQRISEFQEMLTKSSKSFSTFRGEMDQMTKKIMKLEKEALVWKERWQQSSRALLDMTEEKVVRDKEMECLQLKLQRLERLCRALQSERGDLASCVKQLTSQINGNAPSGEAVASCDLPADNAPACSSPSQLGSEADELAGLVSGDLVGMAMGVCVLTDSASCALDQFSWELTDSKFSVRDATSSSAGEAMPSPVHGASSPCSPPGEIGEKCPDMSGDGSQPLVGLAQLPALCPAPVLRRGGDGLSDIAAGQILTSLHATNTDTVEKCVDPKVGRVESDTTSANPDEEAGKVERDVGGNPNTESGEDDSRAGNVALGVSEAEGKLSEKQPEPEVHAVVRNSAFDSLQASCQKLEESFSLINAMCQQSQGFLNSRKQTAGAALEEVANGSLTGTPLLLGVEKERLEASPKEGNLILFSDQQGTVELSSSSSSTVESPSDQDVSSSASR